MLHFEFEKLNVHRLRFSPPTNIEVRYNPAINSKRIPMKNVTKRIRTLSFEYTAMMFLMALIIVFVSGCGTPGTK